MQLLAIETSQTVYSVALMRGDALLAAHVESVPHRQAEDLIPAISRLLEETGVSIADLDGYAVTVGPGSFTGIRTGLAALLGMTIVTQKPIFALSTLELTAWQLRELRPDARGYLPIINAYRGQWYHQRFDGALTALEEPSLSDALPATDESFICGGLGLTGDLPLLPLSRLDAAALGRLTVYKHNAGLPFLPAEPLYIREPDAKLPKAPLQAG